MDISVFTLFIRYVYIIFRNSISKYKKDYKKIRIIAKKFVVKPQKMYYNS